VPSTELSILVPVLRRPQNVEPLIESVFDATEGVLFEIVFITSRHDIAEQAAVVQAAERLGPVVQILTMAPAQVGDYGKKINHAYQHTTSPWLFLGADDLSFRPGWFDHAKTAAICNQKRVVGTQDFGNRRVMSGEHATHSLVHRSYVDERGTIDEPGKVLHEGYIHCFVDDEFIATAKHRDEFVFAWDSHVEHMHPDWGKASAQGDVAYSLSRRSMGKGRALYARRQRLWTFK